jgi:glycerol kinase
MTDAPLVLAIDQGTTSTRAMLFDAAGRLHHLSQTVIAQHYPHPGWVEQDPEEIWRSVVTTCRAAVAAADGPIAALGIANQRETTVLWQRSDGRPVANAIVWQDRRTADLCKRWCRDGLGAPVTRRTGLVIDPYFSASKIAWLLDHVAGLRSRARAGEIAFGTIDTFLLWRLSGGLRHATDATNAARTMLFDIRRLDWDAELLSAFDIPHQILPEICDTAADFGSTAPAALGAAIPIGALVGDQQAALIGQGCFRRGMVKSTYGTGAFALLNTGAAPVRSRHRLLTTLAYRFGGRIAYALEGSIFVAGAAVDWLRERLGLFAAAGEAETLAGEADPSQRVFLVPGFAGLGAPYWTPQARGAILGLTAACGPPEIARAALEAVGYQTRDLVSAMSADAGGAIEVLRVDGGMAASDWTMQFLADIVPAVVERPASIETTAWGAAYAAGLARAVCPEPETMMAGWRPERCFAPQMDEQEREERYAGWHRAAAGVLAATPRSEGGEDGAG